MSDDPPSEQPPDDAREPTDEDAPGPEGEEAPGSDEDESGEEEGKDRRPISVRDLMPEPSPERRSREPPRRSTDEDADAEPTPTAPAGPDDVEEEEPEDEVGEEAVARPTPVRVAMDAPPPGDSRPVESLPSRTFEARGQKWVVRITGRTITGTRPDPGALLMQLEFYRAEDPETPVRELLTVNRPLEALYPEDLEEYLGRSREAASPDESS